LSTIRVANTTIHTVIRFKGDGWSTGEKNIITINSFPIKQLQTRAGWVLCSSVLLCYAEWNTDTKTELHTVQLGLVLRSGLGSCFKVRVIVRVRVWKLQV